LRLVSGLWFISSYSSYTRPPQSPLFPTRRSSDLKMGKNKEGDRLPQFNLALLFGEESGLPFYYRKLPGNITDVKTIKRLMQEFRSEEHTSELQSRENLVCRLLLEKKNMITLRSCQ